MTPAANGPGPEMGPSDLVSCVTAEPPFEPTPLPAEVCPEGWDEERAARRVRRRLRWQLACGTALALAVASFATALVSRVYEARASVLVRPPGHGGPAAIGGALQAEVEILKSSEVMRQGLESVGAAVLFPDVEGTTLGAVRAAALDRMHEALRVRTLPDSDVIEVTFRHADPQLAAEVVNRLVERFRRSRREALAPEGSRLFLTEQIAEQRRALETVEASLAAFHAAHPEVAAPDPRRLLAERRSALEAERLAQRDAADRARNAGSTGDASVERARARLDELEFEMQTTLNTHVEGSRAASRLRSEIERVRGYVAERESAARQRGERALEQLRSREKELEAELAALGRTDRELAELERRERELARERDVAARRLEAYEHELVTAALAADVGLHELTEGVRVLEAAEPPVFPIVPEERVRQAWALIGGALLVLVLALLGDFVDQLSNRRSAPVPPAIWVANVGAGDAGSLAVLMPNSRGGARGAATLMIARAGESGAGARGSKL